jgi:hypothetical protein
MDIQLRPALRDYDGHGECSVAGPLNFVEA